jgi:hypothetical protein
MRCGPTSSTGSVHARGRRRTPERGGRVPLRNCGISRPEAESSTRSAARRPRVCGRRALITHQAAHAAAVSAPIRTAHPRDAGRGDAADGEDSFPQTDGDRLTAKRMFRAALMSPRSHFPRIRGSRGAPSEHGGQA